MNREVMHEHRLVEDHSPGKGRAVGQWLATEVGAFTLK